MTSIRFLLAVVFYLYSTIPFAIYYFNIDYLSLYFFITFIFLMWMSIFDYYPTKNFKSTVILPHLLTTTSMILLGFLRNEMEIVFMFLLWGIFLLILYLDWDVQMDAYGTIVNATTSVLLNASFIGLIFLYEITDFTTLTLIYSILIGLLFKRTISQLPVYLFFVLNLLFGIGFYLSIYSFTPNDSSGAILVLLLMSMVLFAFILSRKGLIKKLIKE